MKHQNLKYFYVLCIMPSLIMLASCTKNHQLVLKKESLVINQKTNKKPLEHPIIITPPKPTALSKNIRVLTYEELEEVKKYYKTINNNDLAIKVVERMMTLSTDLNKLKSLRLELADLYFDYKSMEKAGKHYSEYIKLFPGCMYREYAEYKAILCRFYVLLTADRDQTMTHETLKLTQAFLNHYPQEKEYIDEIKRIQFECQKKIFESERYVFDFYCRQNYVNAAKNRMAYIKETIRPLLSEIEPELLAMEYQLAQITNDKESMKSVVHELVIKFPEHEKTAQVVALNNPRKFNGYRF